MKVGINFMHKKGNEKKAPESTQDAAAAVIWREERKKIQLK